MKKKINSIPSKVEQIAMERNKQKLIYPPIEKIGTIIVDNFPELGKLTAMRFLEWAQNNEGSTISLPTGKTPEHFIKWVTYLLTNWNIPKVQKLLEECGVNPAKKPDMRSFHFVQIDEFYPINSTQHNSFYYYVNKFYIRGFGLDPQKALLINPNQIGLKPNETLEDVWPDHIVDLSLRFTYPKDALQKRQKEVLAAVERKPITKLRQRQPRIWAVLRFRATVW